MRTILLFLVTGCNFEASSKVAQFDTASRPSDGDAEPGDSDGGESGAEPDPMAVDDDEDGHTENTGDCDDTDDGVYPGAEDVCDGIDNNCNDEIDEEALDEFEPNDSVEWSLGIVGSDTISVDGFLHSEEDVDLFNYIVDDGIIDLVVGIKVKLSGFTSDIVYRMTITESTSGQKVFDQFKAVGDDELLYDHDDTWFGNESGRYVVRIKTLGGFGCEHPYTLTISEDTILR